MIEGKYNKQAADVAQALRMFAENPDNIETFESYLRYHFDVWLTNYAHDPDGVADELLHFARF